MRHSLVVLALALGLGGSALAETRTLRVNLTNTAGKPVPVAFGLLKLRDTIGAEFATQWTTLRVTVGGREVPYQIDDLDGNGRITGGDELAFLATGPAVITVSDQAGPTATYPAAFRVAPGADGIQTITATGNSGFTVEVSKLGLPRITGYRTTKGLLADEIGNIRLSGYPASTFYRDQKLGEHVEKTLAEGGMSLTSSTVLPAGPARTVVVSRYTSPLFVGLEQTIVSRIYPDGALEQSSDVVFRGYSDLMKLEHQATRLMTEADPDVMHLAPIFRRVAYADFTKQTPAAFYASADRGGATLDVGGKTYLAFKANGNLKNPFWGGQYLFVSPEPWRTNYSDKLDVGVAEIALTTPAAPADYTALITGNQWQLESGEFRTGVFRWLPDEFKTVDALKNAPAGPSRYAPGDTVGWRFLYEVYAAANPAAAVTYLAKRQADLASITIGR